jgi:type IV pilus assembly protein PilW
MQTPYCRSLPQCPRPRAYQLGLSLIELMVSISIGLVIIVSLVGVLESGSSSSRTNDRTSEMSTNGRYALASLKEELRQAGFRGYTWALPSTPGPWVDPVSGCTDSASSVGAFVTNIGQGVWGADNSNPFSGNCIPSANYAANTDVLVIRRLGGVPVTPPLIAEKVYFQSSYSQGQMFRSTSVPVAPTFTGGALPVATFPLLTYVYYISPFTTVANESPRIPALWRMALQKDGTMARELVASGIERMQVQYGVLSTVPDVQFYDSIAGTASETVAANPTVNWPNVDSVRVWLLARNATTEPGYTNSQTYAMGNQPYTVNDGFRRQLFTTVVQLRN